MTHDIPLMLPKSKESEAGGDDNYSLEYNAPSIRNALPICSEDGILS